jgi:hypothetical protein
MDVFSLFGSVSLNDDATKGLQKVQKEAKNTDKEMNGMVETVKNIGKAIVAAFAIDKIIDFGKNMVETSAKLKALDSQFEQTFKDNQGQAMDMINKQVTDQGIHVDRLRGAWSSFYGTFRGNGADANQSLDLTSKYMTLAGDASAYYDTSLEDVTSRLKSLVMGNFEAGDAIGININATKMDTKAKEQYGKAWKDLSDTEKEYLLIDTVGKIYESNGAMGQASREADGYENVMGNLKASWDRFLEVVGSPILAGVVTVVQNLTTAVTNLTTFMQEHEVLFTTIAVLVGVLTTGIIAYTIAMNAGAIATFFMTTATTAFGAIMAFITSPIGLVTLAIMGLIAIGVLLWQNWDWVKAKALEIWGAISGFVKDKLEAMGIDTTSFESVVNGVFNKLLDIMTKPFQDAYAEIMRIGDKIKNSINNLFNTNIKLPHFRLNGEFSLMPPSVPKLAVDWYSNGGIFTQPTILNGIGVGDKNNGTGSNAEVVAPLNDLARMLKQYGLTGNNNQPILVKIDIDGREVAYAVAENQDVIDDYNNRSL